MSTIFVFGSNLAGRHGAGAAREAHARWGAVYGEGVGHFGQSYAIPTKDHEIQTMPIHEIASYVAEFVAYAAVHPDHSFLVTAIGCGIAGATENVFLSEKLVAALR